MTPPIGYKYGVLPLGLARVKNYVGRIPKVDRKSEMKYVFLNYETSISLCFRKKSPPPKFRGQFSPFFWN